MSEKSIPSQATDFLYNIASGRSFLRSAAATALAGMFGMVTARIVEQIGIRGR